MDRFYFLHHVFFHVRNFYPCISDVTLNFSPLKENLWGIFCNDTRTAVLCSDKIEENPFRPTMWAVIAIHELYHGWQYSNGVFNKKAHKAYCSNARTYWKIEAATDAWAIDWIKSLLIVDEKELEFYLEHRPKKIVRRKRNLHWD